ncbi:MAG: 2-C-methyl-D-erythritol 4-phosphate cytidylyltransferase [Myxococcota bacterium]
MGVAALLLAAGRGDRLGDGLPKAFVPVAGRPLLQHALEALARADEVDLVVPVLARGDLPRWQAALSELRDSAKLGDAVVGGAERQDSMAAGLAALPDGIALVAVHDAARPLVRSHDVDRVVRAAARDGAAILAVPVGDTIKRVRGGRIVETPERSECYAAQTPQVFRVEILREALAKASAEGRTGTDDAQLVEALGVAVTVVEGDVGNLKVTHPEDLVVAERLLRQRAEGRGAA